MPRFSPQDLARWTGGRWTAEPTQPLHGFSVDSRQLGAGQVFVALKTEKRDGHDFVPAAASAGASAAIVAAPQPHAALPQLVVTDPLAALQAIAREHRRAFTGRVIGISGSAGKTSTKDLLALLLGSATGVTGVTGQPPRGVLATEANLNNHIGVPLTLTRIDPAQHAFAVVEAGISGPGEMDVLADMIQPDVAIITLVGPAHTEELGGLEGVAREKAKLPAATRALGVAVFTRESAAYPAFRELGVRAMIVERADVLRPAEPPKDTVYFTLTQRAEETAVALAYGAPPPRVFTFRRVSDGMAQNAVLAICAALWLGVPIDDIQHRLALWQPAKLRGEVRRESGRLLYLDCYNANPASMADALSAFDAISMPDVPRLYILGSMEELGADAAAYHQALGRSFNLRTRDRLYVVGSHAEDVRDGALEVRNPAAQVQVVAQAADLTELVREWKGAVFIKGSRRYQLERVLERAGSGAPA